MNYAVLEKPKDPNNSIKLTALKHILQQICFLFNVYCGINVHCFSLCVSMSVKHTHTHAHSRVIPMSNICNLNSIE